MSAVKLIISDLHLADYLPHGRKRRQSQLTFAIVNATPGEPSSASLCIWEGGTQGSYRVLA